MSKICSKCGIEKPAEGFYGDCSKVDGKSYACKKCSAIRSKKFYSLNITKLRADALVRRNKNPEKAREDARLWRMKNPEKQAAATESWAKRNPERVKVLHKKNNLRRKYGLTLERYEEMEKAQDEACYICKKKNSSGRRLAVDHNHATGEIRALLCGNCNSAIGHVNDSVDLLRLMIKYLEKFSTPKALNQQTNKNQTESN